MSVKLVLLGITAIAASLAFAGWRLTAQGAYESAEYSVVESDGVFEIREYPDLQMATTAMPSQSQRDNGSFMRLFQYISGGNESQQKISMTTPVFMQPQEENDPGQMSFVIPKKVSQQGAPAPSNANVNLSTRRGGQFAVIRFAGRMGKKDVRDAETKLRAWMASRSREAADSAEYAGYDPPWTPGPLRRNEILIRLK